MKKIVIAGTAISIIVLTIISSASAFEGGGRKPSEAPLVTVGQHYTGQLNNHANDANFEKSGSGYEVAIWRLPPVTTRDVVTIDWHGAPFTHEGSGFPVCLVLAQGVDDFSWGNVFGSLSERSCYETGPVYSLSGSGSAKTAITVQETNANSSYLEFFSHANQSEPARLETYPYDFTVEPILHYLAAAIRPVKRVSAGGILHASANLATGLPVPDGLSFNLAVTWPRGGVASYSATSGGGTISFQLALPETAYGKTATFVVSHPADGIYQAVTTPKLEVLVAKPKPPPPSLCVLARRREVVLTRQLKRLKRHANRAHGIARRRLNRRVRQAKRKLHRARVGAEAAC
ncbi:MAG TPA: hypothetical protein VHQ43_09980 [Solirubrobacterales bacterium]|jgi:hypothetical protein|nr:hypothetical protein [Solirubrobacterales bacterium]